MTEHPVLSTGKTEVQISGITLPSTQAYNGNPFAYTGTPVATIPSGKIIPANVIWQKKNDDGTKPSIDKDETVTYVNHTQLKPDGTKITADGVTHCTDGAKVAYDGTILKPARAMIENVEIKGNKAKTILSGEVFGAEGYDYVISENPNCIVDKDYLDVNKNELLTTTDFYYVQKGTYYAYCHAWIRDENGRFIYPLR